MAENVYEGMFILDSSRYGRDPEAVSGRILAMIQEAGGEMLVSRLWEERRLAYPIKGQRRGTYWLTYFRLDSNRLTDVERQCRLDENILRKLFLKVEPRIVETLVTHAQTVLAPAPRGDEDKQPAKPEAESKQHDDATAEDRNDSDLSEVADEGESVTPP